MRNHENKLAADDHPAILVATGGPTCSPFVVSVVFLIWNCSVTFAEGLYLLVILWALLSAFAVIEGLKG